MNQEEVAYWDDVAEATGLDGTVSDNWLKRQMLGQFLLKSQWFKQSVLEIGCGNCMTAGLLALSCGRMWNYIGTDLSPKWVKWAKNFGLDAVQGDVLSLPDGQFSRILALDSLEHVKPEDRPDGYRAIAERLSPQGLLFINMPKSESGHKTKFDHGIGLEDLRMLEDLGLKLSKYDLYSLQYPGQGRRVYAFVVMTK